jgi:two-component system chemotaxis response regulator CheB
VDQAREAVATALLPRIRAIVERQRARGRVGGVHAGSRSHAAPRRPSEPPARGRQRARAVFVAASTGGPRALAEMLRGLPAALSAPIVIVQHMPAMFTGYLAHGLASQCALRVSEAYPGARLEPGQVWIAPGDHHLTVRLSARGLEAVVQQGPHENGCRPSADPLFRSAAETFGHSALAVVLTGMGQDGMLGARAVRDAGGGVIVQDEASSVIWGMPGSVARAGLADRVLPLGEIAAEIAGRCDRWRRHAA